MRAETFIAFFTVCGFFIGVTFSTLKLSDPIDMLVYTFLVTFFFYLLVHVVIINYLDVKASLKRRFDKELYEQRADYLIGELGLREKRIDNLLNKLASENILIKQTLNKSNESNAKAA